MAKDVTVQRNFLLPREQAEWLRDHAFRARRSQAEIVREALAEYRARADAGALAVDDHALALTERFAGGIGVDLDLLRDKDKIWSHENA